MNARRLDRVSGGGLALLALALVGLISAACSSTDADGDGVADVPSDAGRDVPSIFQDGASDAPETDGGSDGEGLTPDELCRSLEDDYPARAAQVVVGGNIAACDPGEMTEAALDDVRRRVNWYRQFYDMPPVPAPVAEINQQEQECALMMAAEGALDHFPGPSWACYTEDGALAASESNLSLGESRPEDHIDGLVVDFGNHDTLGHRRWILFPGQQGLGYGFIANAFCQRTFSGSVNGALSVLPIAYPPPGAFPAALVGRISGGASGNVAWSVSWGGADFGEASLSLEDDATDEEIPLASDGDLRELPEGYGDNTAIFIPGRTPAAGDRWRVRIEGIRRGGTAQPPLVYTVDFVDCD